ncbi:transient receptor potential cation channel subfamily A member 1 homolog isoform X2 [Dendronephthya gigantea]|nr:transient receptor potential cation channel subfamily A member 1 homolog isoform X2 [Dendronephthya gigantea]XP_028414479.1 transient receptor potential cation channel subfamily A member 1 homolog isoform X2 [Dendronephthya gigantea]
MDDKERDPINLYKNDAFSPSLEMNTVAPAFPRLQPSSGPTCVAYAVGKFENSHITIFQASRDGRLDIVKNKLAKGKRDINKKDEENATALHYAVRFNHTEIVKFLISKGANPNLPGEDGATPMHYAARYRPLNVLKQLKSTQSNNEVNAEPPSEENASAVGNLLTVDTPDITDADQDSSDSVLSCLLKKSSSNVNCQDNYGSTPLHYAAAKGNPRSVEELIRYGRADVNAKDKQKATPLHEACTQGNPNVAKLLVQAGADLQARDNEKMTPLHYAAMSERVDCVKIVVDAAEAAGGSSLVEQIVAEVDREGQTALHIAVDASAKKTAQYLLFKGAEVNAVRMNMATPLHLAATAGDLDTVEMLLNFKANVEAKNMSHETPLHKAALFNNVPVIDLLLDRGANIESRDKDNYTALLVAVAQGNKEATDALLRRDANIRVVDSSDKTAIYIAAEENCLEILELLMHHHKAKRLLEESDKYGNTPLHIAAKKGFINAVRQLLNEGADIDAVNLDEQTPLHMAAKSGKENIVKELISNDGTIINDEDADSNTALHLAATNGHHRVIEALLDKGAIIDARNLYAWTPLDCAASQGWTKSARVLIEYEAPIDPIDKARVTPLHLASQAGHLDMIKLLLDNHADIALRDVSGRNALDMAVDEGHKSCAIAILNRENWRKAMRSRSVERGITTTPLRKMIIKEPDVAEVVFNKCTTLSDDAPDSHEFTVNLDYEFLEDIYAEWVDTVGDDVSISSDVRPLQDSDSASLFGNENAEYKSIDTKTEDEKLRELERKRNHPLMLMVKHSRESLITHPLVVFLLDRKWSMYGRKLFYVKLVIFLIFLMFLTGYVIMATPSQAGVNVNGKMINCTIVEDSGSMAFEVFVDTGRYILLILACLHILFELFQFLYQRWHYVTDYTNYFEVTMYVATVAYISADFDLSFVTESDILSGESCSLWRVNVGAVAIFLAWIVLVLFVRKFPMFGIYIVMFEDIIFTFLRFSIILGLFTIAFGLAFYTMLHRHWVHSFRTPGLGLLKTFVMVIGEFEYDSGFSNNEDAIGDPPVFAYILFVLFIIIMTILLMNLLVGLAVDDIKAVQAQANLKRQAMLVDLALNVEKAFPRFIRRKLIPELDVVHPNWMREKLFISLDGEAIRDRLRFEKSPFEKIESRQDETKETVKKLKWHVSQLNNRTEKIEMMLKAIVSHMKVEVNEDEYDDDND